MSLSVALSVSLSTLLSTALPRIPCPSPRPLSTQSDRMATLADSSSSNTAVHDDQLAMSNPVPDKISAYYSLVFPNFTYYIQTLKVIIGRRCIPSNTPSSSENPLVDVDLGSLKSVSRLHAKIEYDEDEERFVLHVMGRNGAWVDGVWSGSGGKVPLGDRSVTLARLFNLIPFLIYFSLQASNPDRLSHIPLCPSSYPRWSRRLINTQLTLFLCTTCPVTFG